MKILTKLHTNPCKTRRCRRLRTRFRPHLEILERRQLLSNYTGSIAYQLFTEVDPNDTLDLAQNVSTLSQTTPIRVTGTIGGPPGEVADADWYRFVLATPSKVCLTALAPDDSDAVNAVLSLYSEDPFDFSDYYTPLGHRLLAQDDGIDHGGATQLERALAPGTYYVAVTGSGNRYFHPFLADSGIAGDTGVYTLQLIVTEEVGADSTDDPEVLAVDPSPGAHDVGDVTGRGLVQVPGTIGDDSADQAADVDLYRIQIAGPGHFALAAEVFAGRIGSPLDPALTLYRADPTNGQLVLVAWNDNTLNDAKATNDSEPLYADAVIFAALTQGEYYLAVSGAIIGAGMIDPSIPHNLQNGNTTGEYVLNIFVQRDDEAPTVESAVPSEGLDLSAPPTHLVVRFSEPVNLQQLAHQQYQETAAAELPAVFIKAADGRIYYPRLLNYDLETGEATFILLDGLPNGENQLHLSGPLGLADLAGNRLVGNDVSGDCVVRFTIDGPTRGSDGNPLVWSAQEPNDDLQHPQVLGVLFPNELQGGVNIVRGSQSTPDHDPVDTADYYQFEVLQSRVYFFSLAGSGLPAGTQPRLTDAAGNSMYLLSQAGGAIHSVTLSRGLYVIHVGGWTPEQAGSVVYQLKIQLGPSHENPTPLTVRAAPAYRIVLADIPAADLPHSPPPGTGNPPYPSVGPTQPVKLVVPTPSPDDQRPGGVQLAYRDMTVEGWLSGINLSHMSLMRNDAPTFLNSIGAMNLGDWTGAPSLPGLPAGALLGLSRGPVGGFGSSDTDQRVRPRLVLGEVDANPVNDSPRSGLSSRDVPRIPIDAILRSLEAFWQQGVDHLFQHAWPGCKSLSAPVNEQSTDEPSTHEEDAPGASKIADPDSDVTSLRETTAIDTTFATSAWLGAGLALAALSREDFPERLIQRFRRKSRKKNRRRKTVRAE